MTLMKIPGESIIKELLENDVLYITGKTGIGKSTSIPIILQKQGYRVWSLQPTCLLARALYDYMRIEVNDVGYITEKGEENVNGSTIVYSTVRHFINMLYTPKGVPKDVCDVLIIDEIHTGTMEQSIVLGILHYMKEHVPKLILLSAMYNIDSYDVFFKAKRIPLSLPYNYPVTINYYGMPIQSILKHFKSAIQMMHKIIRNIPNESVLIFAPGTKEVENIQRYLNAYYDDSEIIVINSDAPHAVRPMDTKRSIYISTHAVGANLNIPDISHVIICGIITDIKESNDNSCVSESRFITASELTQQTGRVGRTRPGVVHSLFDVSCLDDIKPQPEREIDSKPLYKWILELATHDLPPKIILRSDSKRVFRSYNKLRDMGALSASGALSALDALSVDNEKPTAFGEFIAMLPVSPSLGHMLWGVKQLNNERVLSATIALVSILHVWNTNKSIIRIPPKKAEQSYAEYNEFKKAYLRDKYADYRIANDELAFYLQVWKEAVKVPRAELYAWCVEEGFSHNKIQDIMTLAEQIADMLGVKICPFEPLKVLDDIRRVFISVFKNNILILAVNGKDYVDPVTGDKYAIYRENWMARGVFPIVICAYELTAYNTIHKNTIHIAQIRSVVYKNLSELMKLEEWMPVLMRMGYVIID